MQNLEKVIVYDNGGKSYDRYTVFTPDNAVYGMSDSSHGIMGFNQYLGDHTEIKKGRHLGKRLADCPESIKWAVIQRMSN